MFKLGSGEVVGASIISVGDGANPLRKVASARMLQQAMDGQKNVTHLLMRKVSILPFLAYLFSMIGSF